MQQPRGKDGFVGLGFAEGMVNFYAESAKTYWRMWGPLGEPMVRGLDAWAEAQHGYLQWLRKTSAVGGRAPAVSHPKEGAEALERGMEEAQRIARESAREAERIARDTEREAREADSSPEEDISSAIRESVRRSEAGVQEAAQAATTVSEETRAGAEELSSIIRESVSRSEAGVQEEAHAEITAPEETRADVEEDISSAIRESVRRSEAGVQEAAQAATTAPEETPTDTEELPIEDYDSLNVNQVTQRLGELSVDELERLRDYEAEHKNRRSLMQRFERRIRAGREDLRNTEGSE